MRQLNIIFSTLFLVSFAFIGKAQINNIKGEIVTSFDYFDANFVARNKIKTVSITYSSKKSLKPIVKNTARTKHYDFDSLGNILRFFSVSDYGIIKQIEWREYKNEKIFKVFKPEKGKVSVHTFYYLEGKKNIRMYGVSSNSSGDAKKIMPRNYKEISSEYYDYIENLDLKRKTKETKSFNKVIFLRNHEYFKDSLLSKEETRFRYKKHKNDSTTYIYNEKKVLIEKRHYPYSKYKGAFYKFKYYNDGRIMSINKYQNITNKFIENREFVYSDKTNFLQAIITKNRITKELTISKYKYTFY